MSHIHRCAVLFIFFTPAVVHAQTRAVPFYIIWEMNDPAMMDNRWGALGWASRELGLDLHQRTIPAGVTITSPKELVEPYRHLTGRVLLISGSPNVTTHSIRLRAVKDEVEYLQRLAELESYFEQQERQPGSTLTRTGPPKRRIIDYQREWKEEESETTIEYVRGIKVISKTTKEGAPLVDRTMHIRHLARLDGNLMLDGRNPAVFEVSARDVHRPARFRDDDKTYFVNVADIPRRTREKVWEQILGPLNTRLQQYDEEADLDYTARRLLGEHHIELIRKALFDVDNALVSVRYHDPARPITATASVEADAGSALSGLLKRIGKATPRLHPFNETANEVFSVHSVSRVPEELAELLRATTAILRVKYTGGGPVAEVIDDTMEQRVLELRLSGRANPERGLACIGAVRLGTSPPSQKFLESFLQAVPELDATAVGGESKHQFLRISLACLSNLKAKLLPETGFIMLPQFAFLHLRDDVLYFSLGGDQAWQVLQAELSNPPPTADHDTGTPGYLLRCTLNLHLATGDHGQQSGLTNYLDSIEQAYARWHAARHIQIIGRRMGWTMPPPSALQFKTVSQKALTDRVSQAELSLYPYRDGLRADLTLDRSLALLYYGREAMNVEGLERARKAAIKQRIRPQNIPVRPADLAKLKEQTRD